MVRCYSKHECHAHFLHGSCCLAQRKAADHEVPLLADTTQSLAADFDLADSILACKNLHAGRLLHCYSSMLCVSRLAWCCCQVLIKVNLHE
jgi:hypothetical protein